MSPLKVLFTHYGDNWVRGSETVLLDLLRCINPAVIEPIVWCNGEMLATACRLEGYKTHCTPFYFFFDAGAPRFDPNAYLTLLREGRTIIREHRPHVLHSNSAAPTQWLLPVARAARLPLLTHLHIRYLRRSRYSLLLHQADSIVGVCEDAVAGLRSDGMAPKKIRVIHNGVDISRVDRMPTRNLRRELGIPLGAVVIGAVGSLIHRKGHDLLIRALASLAKSASLTETAEPHLIIAGDGPEREQLLALTVESGLTRRVHFVGYCDPVVDLYRSVDVVALATRGDALPLALVEAGLCGKPVISTRVGGVSEAVSDGETGLIVSPENVEELVKALERLILDPKMRETMGAAARRRVETFFSATRMARSFEVEYSRLATLDKRTLGWTTIAGRFSPYTALLKRPGNSLQRIQSAASNGCQS